MLKYIDKIPLLPLAVIAIFMLLAPFQPEPHLLEKSRMLVNGELSKGIDIFDLLWHSFLMALLVLRLIRLKKSGTSS
ncbi:hypothetical protein MNBD_GAMMA06-1016 [hydrothermal vent metagenome]|uniref:RND transporter n=1 Tax=hydrothermal vent metagenome TaxID=652676 RepID=A0A3B0WXZ3_9ZZZZ